MPLVTHHRPFVTKAVYFVSLELVHHLGRIELDAPEDPKEALQVAQELEGMGISYSVSRTIHYLRGDGYNSEIEPEKEDLDLKRLEGIAKGLEELPVKTYPVYDKSPKGVDEGD